MAFDDLSWTCYTLSTGETSTVPNLSLYPNPVVNDEIFVKGTDLKKVLKADIYSADGRLVQSVAKPFVKSDSIKLNNLKSGVYFLTMDGKSIQFIVK